MLDELGKWYQARCDGDWEHRYGIKINTLPFPGWSVQIDLTNTGTVVTPSRFESEGYHTNLTDWVQCDFDEKRCEYRAAGDPSKLVFMLNYFLERAEESATKSNALKLQEWYQAMCNGEWEINHEININTVDNPAWSIRIDIEDIGVTVQPTRYESKDYQDNDEDWMECEFRKERLDFGAVGDPSKLDFMIGYFFRHIEQSSGLET